MNMYGYGGDPGELGLEKFEPPPAASLTDTEAEKPKVKGDETTLKLDAKPDLAAPTQTASDAQKTEPEKPDKSAELPNPGKRAGEEDIAGAKAAIDKATADGTMTGGKPVTTPAAPKTYAEIMGGKGTEEQTRMLRMGAILSDVGAALSGKSGDAISKLMAKSIEQKKLDLQSAHAETQAVSEIMKIINDAPPDKRDALATRFGAKYEKLFPGISETLKASTENPEAAQALASLAKYTQDQDSLVSRALSGIKATMSPKDAIKESIALLANKEFMAAAQKENDARYSESAGAKVNMMARSVAELAKGNEDVKAFIDALPTNDAGVKEISVSQLRVLNNFMAKNNKDLKLGEGELEVLGRNQELAQGFAIRDDSSYKKGQEAYATEAGRKAADLAAPQRALDALEAKLQKAIDEKKPANVVAAFRTQVNHAKARVDAELAESQSKRANAEVARRTVEQRVAQASGEAATAVAGGKVAAATVGTRITSAQDEATMKAIQARIAMDGEAGEKAKNKAESTLAQVKAFQEDYAKQSGADAKVAKNLQEIAKATPEALERENMLERAKLANAMADMHNKELSNASKDATLESGRKAVQEVRDILYAGGKTEPSKADLLAFQGNVYLTDGRRARQAMDVAAAHMLRAISGLAATDSEYARIHGMLAPAWGDDAKTIKQKLDGLEKYFNDATPDKNVFKYFPFSALKELDETKMSGKELTHYIAALEAQKAAKK